jgi:acetyl-CoA C-acetyltransferase
MNNTMQGDVYIIDGLRTPYLKFVGKPNPLSAADLAIAAIGPLLARQNFKATDIGEVIAGCVAPAAEETNIGRIIALRSGCGIDVPGWTVQRNCASGLQALDSAYKDVSEGRYDLVLAGGCEAMSRAPLIFRDEMTQWLGQFQTSKGFFNKLRSLLKFKPQYLIPEFALLKGLRDPVVNLSMGQTAEEVAFELGISREEMDRYSLQSHERAVTAIEQHYFEEVTPLFDWRGNVIETDTGIRKDSSLAKLSNLKAVFDKPFGQITAGNSSQVTDGAAFLILASDKAVKKYQLPVLGKIKKTTWAALDPAKMGLGPAYAIAKLLHAEGLSIEDIDYWEINEAFAAQVLACVKALNDSNFCQKKLGLDKALGLIPMDRLNVDGGAIAIGHPVGSSGARLVLHLLHILKRSNAKRGIASLCIGGGQGGAMLVET